MKSVNPCLLPADIEEILVQTAAQIVHDQDGNLVDPSVTRAGIIDAYAAVQMAETWVGQDQTWSGNEVIGCAMASGNVTIESGSDCLR